MSSKRAVIFFGFPKRNLIVVDDVVDENVDTQADVKSEPLPSVRMVQPQ